MFAPCIVGAFALTACSVGCSDHLVNTGPCCCSYDKLHNPDDPCDPFSSCKCICSCCTQSLGEKLKICTLYGTYAGLGVTALSVIFGYIYRCIHNNSIPDDFTEVKKTDTK